MSAWFCLTARPPNGLLHLVIESHIMEESGAYFEEKHEPAIDIDVEQTV
jgi:hypothetical protein